MASDLMTNTPRVHLEGCAASIAAADRMEREGIALDGPQATLLDLRDSRQEGERLRARIAELEASHNA